MSSATDLTKAWLASLPADVDEPTPSAHAQHRSTYDAREGNGHVLSSFSNSTNPLRRQQSCGDTNGHVKRHLAKVSTSAQSLSGGGAKLKALRPTDAESSSDVDKAFEKLLGDFSVPREATEVGKMTGTGNTSSHDERDRETSKFLWSGPTVIKERVGQRRLPVPDGRNPYNTRQERSEAEELTEEVREESKETGPRRYDRDVRSLRCNNTSRPTTHGGPMKAFSAYKPQHFFARSLTVSESDAINDSTFRKPVRNATASPVNRTYQSSRDFATQTFGQMETTSLANSEVQTEISAVAEPDDVLKHSLRNIREPVEKHSSQHSLENTKRNVASSREKMAADDRMINEFSKCRSNSSKSLNKNLETSKRSNGRALNERFDDSVEEWSKKDVRSAEHPAIESDRFNSSCKEIPTADTSASVKSRSLSNTSNSRRLMSLMLEEVKALKSFVQTHLDENQTTSDRFERNQTRTRPRLEEKDPDSDSAVELAIIDKTAKKRDNSERSKHRSHRSRRHHRRTEDDDFEDEYRPRRRSPTREKTWDDIRRRTNAGDDLRNRYLSTTQGQRHLDLVGAPGYNAFPQATMHPSNYNRFMPATGVNPTVYQSPFQVYHQNRNVVPVHGFGQPSMMLPTYQPDLANRLGYAPMNTQPVMYGTMPAEQTIPLGVPFPNSVAVVPAVEPAAYQTTVRPALTFVPAGVTPMGQTIQSIQSVWGPQGQLVAKDNETRGPIMVTSGRENLRDKGNESSTRNSFRSGSQPRRLMNSLNDALREAQDIRNLTERLGKDTQLPSYCY